MRDALLEIDFVVRDDSDRRCFGTCSACCRDGDDGRVVERVDRRFVQIVYILAWVHEEECRGFGGIDSGTSPNADDKVGVKFACDLGGLPYCIC